MATQLLSDCALEATTRPWLEYNETDGRPGPRTTITSSPFSIGRGDAVDLKVESSRVSRNHATIVHEDDGYYYIRDSDSTNGISVNGKRVRVWRLSDGDTLAVADIEFVFSTSERTRAAEGTQAVSSKETVPSTMKKPKQLVHLVRHLNESTSLRTVGNLYQPIVSFEEGDVWGYEAVAAVDPQNDEMSDVDGLSIATDCPMTRRRRRIHRLIAVEEMRRRFPDRCVLMSLTLREVKRGKELHEEMRPLCFIAPRPEQIVLGIPAMALTADPDIADVCRAIRSLGARIACIDVSHARELARSSFDDPVDFLRLSPTLVRGIDRNPPRQQRLRTILNAGLPSRAKIIAGGIENEGEAEICIRLGCDLAQGDHFQSRHRSPFAGHAELG